MIHACRVELRFHTDPPLEGSVFPGPALRGLIGRRLEELGSSDGLSFLRERFRPGSISGDTPAHWRLGFTKPPSPTHGSFEVALSTFGPSAQADLTAIIAALAAPNLPLRLPGPSRVLNLRHLSQFEETVLNPFRNPVHSPATQNPPASRIIQFVTPLLLSHAGQPITAAGLHHNPGIVFHSLRLRVADLAGMRRNDPRVPSLDSLINSIETVSSTLVDVRLPLVFDRKPQSLVGILGSLHLTNLTPPLHHLLESVPWIGIGKQTTFGAGSALINPPHTLTNSPTTT